MLAFLGLAGLWLPSVGRPQTSTPPQIRLTIGAEGVYAVAAASLSSLLGLSASAVQSRILAGNFQLLNRGHPTGWLPDPTGSQLFFYAQPLQNNYTSQNVYWLVDGTNQMLSAVDGGAPAVQTNGYYQATTNIEQDIYCRYELATNPDSNYWFWANLVGSHPTHSTLPVSFNLDALGPTNLSASLTVRVFGATATNHAVTLAINGVTNAGFTGSWSNIQPAGFTFAVPMSLLRQGSNSGLFTALGPLSSKWWLDGFGLSYPRPYWATGGRLVCQADSNTVVTAGGFSNSNINVLDITSPLNPLWVTNVSTTSVAGIWSASFAAGGSGRRFSIWQSDAELGASAIDAVWPAGLASPTNRAVLVVIAPTNLLATAQSLVAYRNHQGLESKLVSLDAIWNEFNGGIHEPVAISNFLAFAGQQWAVKPAYALLVGNGTYDYRNVLGAGDNLVPPLMIPTLYGLAASDTAYGLGGSGAGLPMAVGRLPVTNSVQLAALINKIEAYEQTPVTSPKAVLLADLADSSAGDFPADMGPVQSSLATAFSSQMILPGNTFSNTTVMRSLLLSNLNSGAELFCYLGHGASQMLGNSGYLTTADVSGLTATTRLPLVSAITCLAGFYAEPGYDCLAQALTLSGNSGAIAVYSASGFSLDGEATELNLGLMQALASGHPGRLGDFLGPAMSNYLQSAHFTPLGMYNLLGDPSLILHGTTAPSALPPAIASSTRNPDGSFSLNLSAQPGQVYALVATTNLALPMATWSTVATGTVPFGAFALTDGASTNLPWRYYRLITYKN